MIAVSKYVIMGGELMSDKYPKLNITDEALANIDVPKSVESNYNLNAALSILFADISSVK